jgi:hypothetical protein
MVGLVIADAYVSRHSGSTHRHARLTVAEADWRPAIVIVRGAATTQSMPPLAPSSVAKDDVAAVGAT